MIILSEIVCHQIFDVIQSDVALLSKCIRICLILLHVNNKEAYQSAHLHSRISAVVCPLETYEYIMLNADIQYSGFLLAEQVCLSLTCMHTPK